jgi:chromosome segregation ATPase
MAAKTQEVNALTSAIEKKTERVGELAVSIVQMVNDLSETQQALLEDQNFLAGLEKSCATKEADYNGRVKTRAEELVALAETIKVLNDDDALELFKKSLPSPGASFAQIDASTVWSRAEGMLRQTRKNCKSQCEQLDFITLALRGKKVSFEKVIKMIDDMVALLGDEQKNDANKKEYCGVQFDHLDDKKKGLERAGSDLETAIADAEDSVATLTAEIKSLEAGIEALDKTVAEATEQRKHQHEDFVELMAQNSAAKELLGFAKNRLNQFYNPSLYKPAPKRELSAQNRIYENLGGDVPTVAPGGIADTGVTVLAQINAHEYAHSGGVGCSCVCFACT